MKTSYKGIEFIKAFEKFSPKIYICPAGYKTIGYGHLIKNFENINGSINHDQALNLLKEDLHISESAIHRLTYVKLKQNQFDMLVSFTFNLGAGAFQRSTLRAKVNREEHEYVPMEFIRWVYASNKILPGLIKRRRAEAEIYTI